MFPYFFHILYSFEMKYYKIAVLIDIISWSYF